MNKYAHLAEENRSNVRKFFKERFERLSCKQKKRYETHEAAQVKNQDVYLCGFCRKYHSTQNAFNLNNRVKRIVARKRKK